jgi:hypothetical protein
LEAEPIDAGARITTMARQSLNHGGHWPVTATRRVFAPH